VPARTPDTSKLHEKLSRWIAADIVSGRLREGDVVPSAEVLAAEHNVSRTVARETLQALNSAGLITIRHGKRTTVTPVHEWRFLDDLVQEAVASGQVGGKLATDLLETRIALELSAVRWCAERATDAQLAEIHAVASTQVRLAASEPIPLNEVVAADLTFHRLLAEGTGNHVVAQMVTSLRRQLVPTWAMEQLSPAEFRQVAAEHLAVAEALCARDTDKAVEVLQTHFRWSADTTLKRTLPASEHAGIERQLYGRPQS
ncbi:FadR family transcriptional regulator, partial [Nonomuraea sp. RK-328]|nr:FadR family transcriptional regulator [Nonomuraea sp. RK-328]